MRRSEPLEHNHAFIHCCCQLGRAVVSLSVIATPDQFCGWWGASGSRLALRFRINSHLMRLAYISYEYPPDTAGGGIATSTSNRAGMMGERCHSVEVFTASSLREGQFAENGVLVNRVLVDNKQSFAKRIVDPFSERHREQPFDLVEGPEYGADAFFVAKTFPAIPLVVMLRTPMRVIDEISSEDVPWLSRLKYIVGRLAQGRRPNFFWRYDPESDIECLHTRAATLVVSPSEAIRDRLVPLWGLVERQIQVIPHPFEPSSALLEIPPDTETRRVTYFGRLEARKGVLELAAAIPTVLREVPRARFRFIGRSLPHPRTREDIRSLLERELREHRHAVDFVDGVPYDQIPRYLADTDICALPSVWESFGFTCLEAMAAARAVVVSRGTGMAEMVDHGTFGFVVEPKNSQTLARALVQLLQDRLRRTRIGASARTRVLDHYNYKRIGQLQEKAYVYATERAMSTRQPLSGGRVPPS